MEADFSEQLLRLENLSRNEVYNIFYGTGVVGGQIIPLCANINRAVDFFLECQSSIDFSSTITTTFLSSTLPVLIEVLIRRTTLRWVQQNGDVIMQISTSLEDDLMKIEVQLVLLQIALRDNWVKSTIFIRHYCTNSTEIVLPFIADSMTFDFFISEKSISTNWLCIFQWFSLCTMLNL